MRLGSANRDNAHEIWIMCARDFLFWLNTFGWTYDPRRNPATVPFITYDYQDEAAVKLIQSIGVEDICFLKSRDMGASWLCLSAFLWAWQFHPEMVFLMGSRNEEYVDKPGNPKSLFWKLDKLLENQPGWLRPNFERTKLSLRNLDNKSVIDGESTTGDFARGDRRTAILLDEFSALPVDDGYRALGSTRDVTRCRIFNFTPQGRSNAAYDVAQMDIVKIRLHWSQHPEKKGGLYTSENGELKILDDNYPFPKDYKFILDGRLRSPAYDTEEKRCASRMEMAAEWDIDFGSSDSLFFDIAELQKYEHQYCMAPFLVGELDYNATDLHPAGFMEREYGRLKLWIRPDSRGEIPPGDYVVGIDISAGTGASNSCISIGRCETGEKVAEFVTPSIRPDHLAEVAIALCRWFHGAYMIWESNGAGRLFGDSVIDRGYRNFYFRQNELSISKRITDIPGWFSSRENKRVLLGMYRHALEAGEFINRSREAIRECHDYVYAAGGSVEHSASLKSQDLSGARENHGDRVIADALCFYAMRIFKKKEEEEQKIEVPPNCFAWRQMQRMRKAEEVEYRWSE